MAAADRLGRWRDDRRGRLLILAQPIGEANAIDLAPPCPVHRPNRSCRRPGEIVPDDDLDRHDREPVAHQNVWVRIFDDVVGADIARGIEPEPGDLRQHLSLASDRSQDPVECAQPIRCDDDAAAIRRCDRSLDLAWGVEQPLRVEALSPRIPPGDAEVGGDLPVTVHVRR